MADAYESGEVCIAGPVEESAEGLARTCHEIINAASAIMVNVDFLAQGTEGEKQGAADDARHSVERIVKLARALRNAPRGAKAA